MWRSVCGFLLFSGISCAFGKKTFRSTEALNDIPKFGDSNSIWDVLDRLDGRYVTKHPPVKREDSSYNSSSDDSVMSSLGNETEYDNEEAEPEGILCGPGTMFSLDCNACVPMPGHRSFSVGLGSAQCGPGQMFSLQLNRCSASLSNVQPVSNDFEGRMQVCKPGTLYSLEKGTCVSMYSHEGSFKSLKEEGRLTACGSGEFLNLQTLQCSREMGAMQEQRNYEAACPPGEILDMLSQRCISYSSPVNVRYRDCSSGTFQSIMSAFELHYNISWAVKDDAKEIATKVLVEKVKAKGVLQELPFRPVRRRIRTDGNFEELTANGTRVKEFAAVIEEQLREERGLDVRVVGVYPGSTIIELEILNATSLTKITEMLDNGEIQLVGLNGEAIGTPGPLGTEKEYPEREKSSSEDYKKYAIVAGVVGGVILLILGVICACCLFQHTAHDKVAPQPTNTVIIMDGRGPPEAFKPQPTYGRLHGMEDLQGGYSAGGVYARTTPMPIMTSQYTPRAGTEEELYVERRLQREMDSFTFPHARPDGGLAKGPPPPVLYSPGHVPHF